MPRASKVRIGDLLVSKGLITEDQLKEALSFQRENGGKIGSVLVTLSIITERIFAETLSDQLKIPFIELEFYEVDPDVVRKIPEKIARHHRILLLEQNRRDNLVAMADPTDLVALDEASRVLGGTIKMAAVCESDLMNILDQVYRRTEDIVSFAKELQQEIGTESFEALEEELQGGDKDAPVAKLLDSIFKDAVQIGASDVHIEPDYDVVRIRMRVDGVLQEDIIDGVEIIGPLVLRLKLMSKLDISEKRLPQDGRFQIMSSGHRLDVRISTLPLQNGEGVVMRLLDQTEGILQLDRIGLADRIRDRLRFAITRPSGLILVTGPTGSGKTTTLYACLTELNSKEKKILTIEDPIEYVLPRVNQVQVQANIDLTFARVLRASLRQDPDIIMIGEMRDEETARIGVRAAMTGHLVLSTLHTNDAISSAIRIVDMGVEGYLVASALRAITAQRLVKKLCDTCKEKVRLSPDTLKKLRMVVGEVDSSWEFYSGKGCSRCGQKGYSGRIAVHEFLEIDLGLAEALRDGCEQNFKARAFAQKGFVPLSFAALEKALEQKTTVEEVIRISGDVGGTFDADVDFISRLSISE